MGRRRAKQKKIVTKRAVKLGTVFRCLQCNHEDAVDCKMDKGSKVGRLTCRVCGVTYQMKINYLFEPIDVYCSWIDSTKAMNDAEASGGGRGGGGSSSSGGGGGGGGGSGRQQQYDSESDEEQAINPAELARKKLAAEEAREKQIDKDADDLFGSSDSDSD
jgi:transcription elongation factor Elf1